MHEGAAEPIKLPDHNNVKLTTSGVCYQLIESSRDYLGVAGTSTAMKGTGEPLWRTPKDDPTPFSPCP
jgi:hypothetical protein